MVLRGSLGHECILLRTSLGPGVGMKPIGASSGSCSPSMQRCSPLRLRRAWPRVQLRSKPMLSTS